MGITNFLVSRKNQCFTFFAVYRHQKAFTVEERYTVSRMDENIDSFELRQMTSSLHFILISSN